MIVTWTIKGENGLPIASDTLISPTPANAAEAYELAMLAANTLEGALIGYVDDDTLPLPFSMAAQ